MKSSRSSVLCWSILCPPHCLTPWVHATLECEALPRPGLCGTCGSLQCPLWESFWHAEPFPSLPLSGKVLELRVWKSQTLFTNLQLLESQWRVNEAFLTHLSKKRMQPHHLPIKLSLIIPTNDLDHPDQSLDEGCLQCGPEIQKSLSVILTIGIPDLQNRVWEQGVAHGIFISGPQRGKCRNLDVVFGNPIFKAHGLNN